MPTPFVVKVATKAWGYAYAFRCTIPQGRRQLGMPRVSTSCKATSSAPATMQIASTQGVIIASVSATPITAARRPAMLWPRIVPRTNWTQPIIRSSGATVSRWNVRFASTVRSTSTPQSTVPMKLRRIRSGGEVACAVALDVFTVGSGELIKRCVVCVVGCWSAALLRYRSGHQLGIYRDNTDRFISSSLSRSVRHAHVNRVI